MNKKDIHAMLVDPVCALEEYCDLAPDTSAILQTIKIALRCCLDKIELDMYKGDDDDKTRIRK